MTLTRQQKRAMARQKHNKHIQVGGFYSLKDGVFSKVKHPILGKDMFSLIKILSVTQEQVTYISPYRSKGISFADDFLNDFEAVSVEDIKDSWAEMELEALSIKGQKVDPQKMYEQFQEALKNDPVLSKAVES